MKWDGIEGALGVRVRGARAVAGGSINDAYRVDTDQGLVFVKTNASPPSGFFEAEADGLARLRGAGARTPEVLALAPTWLALEWLEPAPAPAGFEEGGRALALAHAHHAPRYGLERDNFMGAVPQRNAWAASPTPASTPRLGRAAPDSAEGVQWPMWERPSIDDAAPAQRFADFFRTCRIEPLAPALPASTRVRLDRVDFTFLGDPPPSLVHGDLWSGNLHHTTIGPAFIDPAVHYGHPEQDLAMTRLFGGFPPAFEAAYREAAGLSQRVDPEFPRRVAALNLYPLLVHVRLFGGGYVRSVEAVLDTLEA